MLHFPTGLSLLRVVSRKNVPPGLPQLGPCCHPCRQTPAGWGLQAKELIQNQTESFCLLSLEH